MRPPSFRRSRAVRRRSAKSWPCPVRPCWSVHRTTIRQAAGQGAAYLFQLQGGQWQHARTLVNPDTGQQSEYAWSVALDGDIAVVGCATCFTQAVGPTNTGSFFSYERHLGGSGNWGLRGEFVSNQPEFIDQFSFSLALSGTVLFCRRTRNQPVHVLSAQSPPVDGPSLQSLIAADPNNTSFGASAAFFRRLRGPGPRHAGPTHRPASAGVRCRCGTASRSSAVAVTSMASSAIDSKTNRPPIRYQ